MSADRCAVAGPRERRPGRHVKPLSTSTIVTQDRICDLGAGWAGAAPVGARRPADPTLTMPHSALTTAGAPKIEKRSKLLTRGKRGEAHSRGCDFHAKDHLVEAVDLVG